MDDNAILAQANDSIQQRQANRACSDSSRGVRPLSQIMESITAKIDSVPTQTDEQRQAAEQRRQAFVAEQEAAAARERIGSVVAMVGRRYADAELDSFSATLPEQASVLRHVRDYSESITDRVKSGAGLFLIGPPGTGKDHLMVAVLKAAARAKFKVLWTDGMEMFAAARDNIDSDRTEAAWLRRYSAPDVLAISDPVPPLGEVKEGFQLATLFSIIDRRYREMKPTLMTLNVADREEAEKRMSVNIVDRLAHGALVLRCNWPSFRR